MREQLIQARVMAVLNHRDSPCRVWRNNVGGYYDARGAYVSYGLAKGSSDLIGGARVTITPEMVGKTVFVFLADEIKTEKGRLSDEQIAFLKMVRHLGGIPQNHRSEQDAIDFVERVRSGHILFQ